MKDFFLAVFALLFLGEGIHVTVGYLRALKGKSLPRFCRYLHWFFALSLLAVWFIWNWYRTFG